MEEMNNILPINLPTESPSIIKVIGVGGGGSNAVKNMYREGIHDVTFVLCNTDRQALASSDIPIKIQLGRETTKGLGAGNDPEVARLAAEESIEDIKGLFRDDTQMVFITAGMGGGTGTGAAPVVARIAKEMDILTVGIVTIPFKFERQRKIVQALKGVEAIARHVDALLVINNERLLETYPNLPVKEGFRVVDETLTVATRSIAEIITGEGIINLDFRDVNKILKDGGVAIMADGIGSGEKRLEAAISDALNSPLLNDNDIYNSRKILFNIYQSPKKPLIVEEFEELNKFMERFESSDIEVIWGVAEDDKLDEEVKITILASGFGMNNIPGMAEAIRERKQKESEVSESERIRQEAEDREMVEKFYGKSKLNVKRIVRTFIMQEADLDNDTLISAIESSPAYRRTSTELAELEAGRTPLATTEKPITPTNSANSGEGVILFS
ncbi:MAG: cell division protein FtsZ [Bacteroidaceae bacterium]|nr:cell division protein FtsZ [Bacteroidaceae bacterium]